MTATQMEFVSDRQATETSERTGPGFRSSRSYHRPKDLRGPLPLYANPDGSVFLGRFRMTPHFYINKAAEHKVSSSLPVKHGSGQVRYVRPDPHADEPIIEELVYYDFRQWIFHDISQTWKLITVSN